MATPGTPSPAEVDRFDGDRFNPELFAPETLLRVPAPEEIIAGLKEPIPEDLLDDSPPDNRDLTTVAVPVGPRNKAEALSTGSQGDFAIPIDDPEDPNLSRAEVALFQAARRGVWEAERAAEEQEISQLIFD